MSNFCLFVHNIIVNVYMANNTLQSLCVYTGRITHSCHCAYIQGE